MSGVFFLDPARKFRVMSVAGPMARSVEDLRLALRIIAGPDGLDTHVPPFSGAISSGRSWVTSASPGRQSSPGATPRMRSVPWWKGVTGLGGKGCDSGTENA